MKEEAVVTDGTLHELWSCSLSFLSGDELAVLALATAVALMDYDTRAFMTLFTSYVMLP